MRMIGRKRTGWLEGKEAGGGGVELTRRGKVGTGAWAGARGGNLARHERVKVRGELLVSERQPLQPQR